MWIVQLALRRPYTFVVMALLILVLGVVGDLPDADRHLPRDRHPRRHRDLDLQGNGRPRSSSARITTFSEYAITSNVNDIRTIESQTLNGVAVIKIYFHPDANVEAAHVAGDGVGQAIRAVMPPGMQPPIIVRFNASSVPILQLASAARRCRRRRSTTTASIAFAHAALDRSRD